MQYNTVYGTQSMLIAASFLDGPGTCVTHSISLTKEHCFCHQHSPQCWGQVTNMLVFSGEQDGPVYMDAYLTGVHTGARGMKMQEPCVLPRVSQQALSTD